MFQKYTHVLSIWAIFEFTDHWSSTLYVVWSCFSFPFRRLSVSASRLQRKFISDQPNEVSAQANTCIFLSLQCAWRLIIFRCLVRTYHLKLKITYTYFTIWVLEKNLIHLIEVWWTSCHRPKALLEKNVDLHLLSISLGFISWISVSLNLQVKEIIKVVKHWRSCTQWKKPAYRPNSYLLSLLVIKAVEDTRT